MDLDAKEYLEYTRNGIVGKLTRALVVDTYDPLFMGRVKVWIPAIHGGYIPPSPPSDPTSIISSNVPSNDIEGTQTLGKLSNEAIKQTNAFLPWAPILSHGWSSTSDPVTGEGNKVFGNFNVPKIGTEVYVIFENNDVDHPVVIGGAFHNSDFINFTSLAPLEVSPSILISPIQTIDQKKATYTDNVANFYVIQSENNTSFIISDVVGQEQIRLYKKIPYDTKSFISEGPSSTYEIFSNKYPNFPSTISSPFEYKKPIGTSLVIPDISVINAPPANTGVVPSSSVANNSTSTTNNTQLTIKKSKPVTVGFAAPKGGQVFKAPRGNNRLHMGVDLGVSVGTPLIAPVDCVPMGYAVSASAGKILLIKGVDGFCHGFVHLTDVVDTIVKNLTSDSPKQTVYPQGTLLGHTGGAKGSDQVSTGPHLHWEVFPGGASVNSSNDIWALRTACGASGGNFKGLKIAPYSYIDPITSWFNNSSTPNTQLILTPSQLSTYTEIATTNSMDPSYDRLIGLDISLTPGAEHIFLRHSSGGCAGFDADGNWKVFTTGDAVTKANRSIIFDSLGGFMINCLAFYNRAKTVAKTASGHFINKLTNNIKYSEFPAIFQQLDTERLADMTDLIKASAGNIYYSLEDSVMGKTLEDIAKDLYATNVNTSNFPTKQYNLTTYDGLIFTNYINSIKNNQTLSIFSNILTPKLLKSQMLKESNGEPDAYNNGSIGLFQITQDAVADTLGIPTANVTNFQDYYSPDKNIAAGIQYLAIILTDIYNITKASYTANNITLNLNDEDKTNMVYCAFLAYNFGRTSIKNYYQTAINESRFPKYVTLEYVFRHSASYSSNTGRGDIALYYVPEIIDINSKTSFSSTN